MGLFDCLSRRRHDGPGRAEREELAALAERLTRLNPRLRLVPGYVGRLAPDIGTALAFARELVAGLPPPRVASAGTWGDDPYIHAFFGASHDVTLGFSRSSDLRDYFAAEPFLEEAYVVLGMAMTERRTLGVALECGVMRSDVPQVTVSFVDHQVHICGADDAALREEIVMRLLDQLVLQGLAASQNGGQRLMELQQEQALLKERLHLLRREGVGLRGVVGGEGGGTRHERARLHARVDQIDAELATLSAPPGRVDALQCQLDAVCDALANAANSFRIERRRIRLSRVNVLLSDDSDTPGDDLEILTAHVPGDPPLVRTFVLARYARKDMMSQASLLDEAERFL